MRSLCTALVALVWVVSASPMPTARAQTMPACPRGGGVLAPATLGPLVMREGAGLGAVSLGSGAGDVVRAWGQPSDCRPTQRGYTYNYYLSDDGGQTGILVVVAMHQDAVEQIVAMLLPHSGGRGPAVRTGRGVAILAPVDEMQRTYGNPSLAASNVSIYASEGVGFHLTKGVVGAILIFKAGAPPPGWNP